MKPDERFILRSLTLMDVPKIKGMLTYEVTFALKWSTIDTELKLTVTTKEGWETARHLACEQIKELARFLGAAAEHEKMGPHIQRP